MTDCIKDGLEVSDEFKNIIDELALASKTAKCVKPNCKERESTHDHNNNN